MEEMICYDNVIISETIKDLKETGFSYCFSRNQLLKVKEKYSKLNYIYIDGIYYLKV